MLAAVFPIYFATVAGAAGQDGDYWWGLGTSASMIIVAVLAPIVGAIADFAGYRKKMFTLFFAIGVGFTMASAIYDNWIFLLCGYAISHIGFSGSCLVYDSFLAEVTTPDRMDKVSGAGFAWGYIGGSTIPFLISIALIMFGDNFGVDNTLAIRISVAMTAIWWAVFTIPFFRDIHQRYSIEKPKDYAVIRAAFSAAIDTAKKILKNKKILFYILAYFFYIDGVGTVIVMSTVYGATLGLATEMMILALFLTQVIAFPCSIWFAALAQRFGSLKLIRFAVIEYLVICIIGFYMGLGLEQGFHGTETATILFFILACMVGTVQGGIQAISRSYFCQMIPPENAGEYFGFFDIFGKFATVLGPLLYAVVRGVTGSAAYSILSIVALFLLGLVMLGIGSKHFKETEKA
jgi:UMF1 family MFS transporter